MWVVCSIRSLGPFVNWFVFYHLCRLGRSVCLLGSCIQFLYSSRPWGFSVRLTYLVRSFSLLAKVVNSGCFFVRFFGSHMFSFISDAVSNGSATALKMLEFECAVRLLGSLIRFAHSVGLFGWLVGASIRLTW